MTDVDGRLAALSPQKRALFEKLLRQRGRTENVFPLSVMQQGIWFLEQLHPQNPAYVVRAAVRIRGQLDTAVLLDAVNQIVARHESLRTTFEVRDGLPVQVIRPELAVGLPETDLRGDATARAGLEDAIQAALAEPIDVAHGPLLRLRLLRLDTDEYVLAVAMHHLVSDGWSVGVLLAELSALYAALIAGQPSPLPPLAIQYGDYATWQRDELAGESLADELAYWRRHLAGAPDLLALSTDRPRPAVQGFRGGSFPFALPAEVLAGLDTVGRQHGATTYMALLAAFQVLLHRYSGQDDIVVGMPMANRHRAEVEPLIGFFVNTLPVRTGLGGDVTFAEVLRRVREACLGAYAHQRLPFETLVEELRPARDLSRSPVFQACLSYQNDPLPTLALAGIRFERLPLRAQGARFDLELQFFNDGGALSGWFEYNRDLFDEATVARMAGHLRRIVEQVVATPDALVGRLELFADGERQAVLTAAAGPTRQWSAGWVHQCVEERALGTPEAEAVRYAGQHLTYAQLNERANRLAHRLRAAGVGRDVLVGVCLHRSVDLVVSLLAILKAGGAYVPWDPGYPPERLRFMLGDCRVPVLLTSRDLRGALPPTDAQVWCVDDLAGPARVESGANPDVPVAGGDAAYVIYTSGSTGTPKGVVNTHAGIRNRLLWMQDEYRLEPGDRVLQKTPFSFDVSVWEFFWPLMCGATLVMARPDGHRDPRYLVEVIRSERVSTLHFVPSMLQVFLQEPGVEGCVSLRRVICSGEALLPEVAQRFSARCGAELHNLYGPTEAAIDVTAWRCRPADITVMPIGFPIANTRVYVLDRLGAPVPVGVPGELHIGGVNVARGYLGRPELTSGRFVPDPFDPAGSGRLYRTGDLGRLRDDGAFEFLGRLDSQVKVRGFRIEPGEIESVLAGHPHIAEAVVVADGEGAGVRLVAYLTGDAVPAAGELIAFLRQRLPEYLVPAAFVALPVLPLGPTGKLDRAALPEPDAGRPRLHRPYVAPRDGLEHRIAGIWRELLGLERVGVDDNFFELGGNSLLMPRVRTEISEVLGREVALVHLFQYPTVGSLAAYLDRDPAVGDPLIAARERADNRRRSLSRRQETAARRTRERNGR